MRLLFAIFDYLKAHRMTRWLALVAFTAIAVVLLGRLDYKEDISDFLPLGTAERESMSVYQDISGANGLYILFKSNGNEDDVVNAVHLFEESVQERDSLGWCSNMTTQFDLETVSDLTEYVYANIPYFLTSGDYAHIDSLLASEDYIDRQLENDRQTLMFPTAGMTGQTIGHDPLGLYAPVLSRLQRSQGNDKFEIYEGCIFTSDMKYAIAMLHSPFGNSETKQNSLLLGILDEGIDAVHAEHKDIDVHIIGGPQIAVGNAQQIQNDSILAIAIAVVLIMALLIVSFRSIRNIMLIAISIGWGWLFAMAGIALFSDDVSIIVIGISSIILGIAVNYPLHFIAHLNHQPDTRKTLKDIIMPLVVGNITTVGAFVALIPLKSVALHDLGCFAALLLVGTILFTIIFLPHFAKTNKKPERQLKALEWIARWQPENNRFLVVLVIILTIVFGWYSLDTEFDSDLSNINYMTDAQKKDMDYFMKIFKDSADKSDKTMYIVSSALTWDEALRMSESKQAAIDSLKKDGTVKSHNGVGSFLCSKGEQERRLKAWEEFKTRNEASFAALKQKSASHGFSPEAFQDFFDVLSTEFKAKDVNYFEPISKSLFSGNLSSDSVSRRYSVVDIVNIDESQTDRISGKFSTAFDSKSMNDHLTNALSDNFNYISVACSCLVFLFLWLSFRRIELAIMSFIPMAVSWLWILGIMALLGIKFNIVNIILATFIFGQGDDYTIFMTEGCVKEYVHKTPIMESYKSSIVQSALIMFIGIGTLIVSKHPALFSLAEVTIIGMFSVVLMAYMLPPLLFRILMRWFPNRMSKL